MDNFPSVLTSELLVLFLVLYTSKPSSVEAAPVPNTWSAAPFSAPGPGGLPAVPGGTPCVEVRGPGLPAGTRPGESPAVTARPPAGFFGVCTEHPWDTTATRRPAEVTTPGSGVSKQGATPQCRPGPGASGGVAAKLPRRSPRRLKAPEPGHVAGRDCLTTTPRVRDTGASPHSCLSRPQPSAQRGRHARGKPAHVHGACHPQHQALPQLPHLVRQGTVTPAWLRGGWPAARAGLRQSPPPHSPSRCEAGPGVVPEPPVCHLHHREADCRQVMWSPARAKARSGLQKEQGWDRAASAGLGMTHDIPSRSPQCGGTEDPASRLAAVFPVWAARPETKAGTPQHS